MIKCECEDYDMFMCWDCTQCTNCMSEYYMVTDDVWAMATEDTYSDIMLCIGCLENRIGDQLTASDFSNVPLNSINLILGSTRLQNRLRKVSASATI
jgi:hypothetical protein